jgi:signal transduction histidine kinase
MFGDSGSEGRVRRLLAVGFILVILLLVTDGLIGFHSIRSIRTAASELADDQFTQRALVDDVQREQGSLSAIFYRLDGGLNSSERASILGQIATTERNIARIVARVPADNPDPEPWRHLAAVSSAFSTEARRVLSLDRPPTLQSRELLRRHEEVLAAVGRLIRVTHARSRGAKERIEALAAGQLQKDAVLLGGSVLLAFLCAMLVMRTSARLYKRMTEQSEQLTHVSWRLLDNQEMVARRLSHELHDELGQALTALKTNLTRHAHAGCADPVWIEDCSELMKESIRSAHEISQLLRPTILDDFGLKSALNWLCDRFSERTGIEVVCTCDFEGRLAAETETHLFRIAQEALTNIARHATATFVTVRLRESAGTIRLTVQDNGRGLPPSTEIRKGAFGLVGMGARAQSSGGALTIHSRPGHGATIDVAVPSTLLHEEKDPHPVG